MATAGNCITFPETVVSNAHTYSRTGAKLEYGAFGAVGIVVREDGEVSQKRSSHETTQYFALKVMKDWYAYHVEVRMAAHVMAHNISALVKPSDIFIAVESDNVANRWVESDSPWEQHESTKSGCVVMEQLFPWKHVVPNNGFTSLQLKCLLVDILERVKELKDCNLVNVDLKIGMQ